MRRLPAKLIWFLLLWCTLPAAMACSLAGFAEHYIQAQQSRSMVDDCYYQLIDDMDKARVLQTDVISLLDDASRRAGYKVGLTDSKVQEMFGIARPLVGVLFENMLLPDGATLELASTTSLLVELDLLARVRSAAINQAGSIEAVAEHIDAILPFIELPDALFQLDRGNGAALLMAGNVGARWGVVGAPVIVDNTRELIESLPDMALRLSDDKGQILRTGHGSQILGHPLNSVLYLLKELQLRNDTIKPGDVISLGAIGGPVKAEQGRRYTAHYRGYGATDLSVSVVIQ